VGGGLREGEKGGKRIDDDGRERKAAQKKREGGRDKITSSFFYRNV